MKKFTQSEIDIIRQYMGKMSGGDIGKLIGRHKCVVNEKIRSLKKGNHNDLKVIAIINNNSCFIPLCSRKYLDLYVIVDITDFHKVIEYHWTPDYNNKCKVIYATSKIKGKNTRIHNFLYPEADEVDHRDHDGLNNRRSNLRSVYRFQNSYNARGHKNGTSKYKGVSWDSQRKKWKTQIYINEKKKFIGRYTNEIQAAKEYDKAAHKAWGEYAYLNFPEEIMVLFQ